RRIGEIDHHLRAGHGLLEPLAGDAVDTAFGRAGDDLVAALAQNGNGLRADQAGAAVDDDLHGLLSLVDDWRPLKRMQVRKKSGPPLCKRTSEQTCSEAGLVPLAAVSRCSELSYETGLGRSEGCGRKAKRRGDTLHTAHDAPLEMPDRSRAEPLHLHAAGAHAGAARARDDRPAR